MRCWMLWSQLTSTQHSGKQARPIRLAWSHRSCCVLERCAAQLAPAAGASSLCNPPRLLRWARPWPQHLPAPPALPFPASPGHAPPACSGATPSQMHDMRSVAVNASRLAFAGKGRTLLAAWLKAIVFALLSMNQHELEPAPALPRSCEARPACPRAPPVASPLHTHHRQAARRQPTGCACVPSSMPDSDQQHLGTVNSRPAPQPRNCLLLLLLLRLQISWGNGGTGCTMLWSKSSRRSSSQRSRRAAPLLPRAAALTPAACPKPSALPPCARRRRRC